MSAFSFQDLEGEIIKGSPDFEVLEEAFKRFRAAKAAMKGRSLDILEFPYTTNPNARPARDNVFIRYYKEKSTFEVKIFQFGHYNARTLIGHFMLKEHKPETSYEMTIS